MGPDEFFELTALVRGTYTFTTEGSQFDTKLAIHAGDQCAAVCTYYNDDVVTGTTWSEIVIDNVGSNETMLIQVGGWNGDSGGGQLNVTIDPCDSGTYFDDVYEPNDSCAGAALITPGLHTGLSGASGSEDWYVVVVPDDHSLAVFGTQMEKELLNFNGFLNDCATQVGGGSILTYSNTSGSAIELVFNAFGNGGTSACYYYALDVQVSPIDACSYGPDSFEPNNACDAGASVSSGTVAVDLNVTLGDDDYYEFCIAPGATADLALYFSHAVADLDLYLYEIGDCNTPLAFSETVSDDESISWTNTTGVPITVVLHAFVFDTPNNSQDCNEYDLEILGTFGCSGTVNEFCQSASGPIAELMVGTVQPGFATHLDVQGGPAFQFGYFLVGPTWTKPGALVGNGVLCLSGGFGRYNVPSSPLNSLGQFNFLGDFVNLSDTSSSLFGFDVPFELPLVGSPIIQGESWSFQLWHREGAGSSNLSTGVEIFF